MSEHIQTHKVLNNSYFTGDKSEKQQHQDTASMHVSPLVSDQYEYALTDDIGALYEQEDNDFKLYEIYKKSPFYKPIKVMNKEGQEINAEPIKIQKSMIGNVFNYMNTEFKKVKKITASERFKAINEFFDFNYEYVYKNVLTPKFKAEILQDYYDNGGMKKHIDDCISEKLF